MLKVKMVFTQLFLCLTRLIRFRICVCTYIIIAHAIEVGCLHLTGLIIFSKSHVLLFFLNSLVCEYAEGILKSIDRLCLQQRLLHRIRLLAAASYWEWRRREVCCNLNFVCRAFRVGRFAGGLFGCLVYVNCTDTRVSIPSFGGFSLSLFALAGVH